MPVEAKKRRRFSPEVRQSLILDVAAKIVAAEGVAPLTMERVAKKAGISKSLVYAYFTNVTDLLRELLDRELKQLRRLQADKGEKAKTFEEMVRGMTHVYLKYIEERGLLIQRLQSEPSVTEGRPETEDYMSFSRDTAVNYVAEFISANFDLPLDFARTATDISFGLPDSAGDYMHRKKKDRKYVEDIAVNMIIGSIKELKANYESEHRVLVRPT